jgi:hypothetical protein
MYSVLGWFAIFSVFAIFGCILMYSDTGEKPYQLILWILASEIILALLVGGAYLIELGGGI